MARARFSSRCTRSGLRSAHSARSASRMSPGRGRALPLSLIRPTLRRRFADLVKEGYFDQCPFHRVVPGFIIQWGIPASPAAYSKWGDNKIKDDPVKQTNGLATLSFATSGPDCRGSQIFVNLDDNGGLDEQGCGARDAATAASAHGAHTRHSRSRSHRPRCRHCSQVFAVCHGRLGHGILRHDGGAKRGETRPDGGQGALARPRKRQLAVTSLPLTTSVALRPRRPRGQSTSSNSRA